MSAELADAQSRRLVVHAVVAWRIWVNSILCLHASVHLSCGCPCRWFRSERPKLNAQLPRHPRPDCDGARVRPLSGCTPARHSRDTVCNRLWAAAAHIQGAEEQGCRRAVAGGRGEGASPQQVGGRRGEGIWLGSTVRAKVQGEGRAGAGSVHSGKTGRCGNGAVFWCLLCATRYALRSYCEVDMCTFAYGVRACLGNRLRRWNIRCA